MFFFALACCGSSSSTMRHSVIALASFSSW
jgi:hypothetical protein